jgi:hypothetical protein
VCIGSIEIRVNSAADARTAISAKVAVGTGIFGTGTIHKRGEGSVDVAIVTVLGLETDVAAIDFKLSFEFEEVGEVVATFKLVGRWRCSSGRLRV